MWSNVKYLTNDIFGLTEIESPAVTSPQGVFKDSPLRRPDQDEGQKASRDGDKKH